MPKQLITENFLVLSPAYGRDYSSSKAAIHDFLDGKDFKLHSQRYMGAYCSILDFAYGVQVILRYGKLLRTHLFEVPPMSHNTKPLVVSNSESESHSCEDVGI